LIEIEGSAWEVLAGTRGGACRQIMLEVARRKEDRRCELVAEVGIGWIVQQKVGAVCIEWDFSVDLDVACIMGVEVIL
jgi:hypothetical protein